MGLQVGARSGGGLGDLWDDYAADEDEGDDLASEYAEDEDDGSSGFFSGMFVSSDDGSAADYGNGSSVGGASIGGALAPPGTPDLNDPIVLGDEIYTNNQTGIARDRGRELGYYHATHSKAFDDSAPGMVGPVLDAFQQGYAEGFALGKQEIAAAKAAGGTVAAKVGGSPAPGPGEPQTFEEGMSTTEIVTGSAIALGLGVAAIAIYKRRKRAR